MERSIEVVGGVPTVTLRLRCRAELRAPWTPTLVVIPGNPGVIDYYAVFMEAVHAALGGAIDVVGVEHAGHSTSTQWHARGFDIERQVLHKIHFLEAERRARPDALLMTAGHSVGAYICLELLGRRPDLAVSKSFMLLPTLHHIGDSPNGIKLTPVFDIVPRTMVAAATGLFSLLPQSMRTPLIASLSGQAAESARITSQHLAGAGVVWNALTMADTEMKRIREVNERALRENGSKIVAFYGQVDGWVPRSHYEQLRTACPEADVRMCPPSVLHAFVLSTPASQLLGEDVAAVVRDAVKSHSASVHVRRQVRELLERTDSALAELTGEPTAPPPAPAGWLHAAGAIAPLVALLSAIAL